MSAILKALRRVEESVQPEPGESPPAPKKINAKKAIRDQYRKTWTIQKLLMAGLPLLTLALVTWVLLTYGPFLIQNSSTAEPKREPPAAKPSPKPGEPVSENRRKFSQALSPGASPVKEEAAAPRGSSKREKKAQEGPSVEDPEFKLQALVWSEAPERRFAVVNGVIVRTGSMIEGVSVSEIGKDHVTFKSGQRTWTMRMMTE